MYAAAAAAADLFFIFQYNNVSEVETALKANSTAAHIA